MRGDGGERAAKRRVRAIPAAIETRVSHDRWLVSYADLLTLLFALFAVLLALSHRKEGDVKRLSESIRSNLELKHELGAGGGPPPPPPATVPSGHAGRAELADQLRSVLKDSVELHQATVSESPEGIVVSFDEAGLFASGEADVVPGRGAAIIAAGRALAEHGVAVRVEGHSDDQPIQNQRFRSNWELSAARAMAVLTLLVDQAGCDPTHLSMAGYGPYRPVADNTSPEGRRKNRRVDLVVMDAPNPPRKTATAEPAPADPAGANEPAAR